MTTPKVFIAVHRALAYGDIEPLVKLVEAGDTAALSDSHCRELMAKLLRGESLRKPGQKIRSPEDIQRDSSICCEIAFLHANGTGLPILSDSQDGADDACGIVAAKYGLSREHIYKRVWREGKDRLTTQVFGDAGEQAIKARQPYSK